jgi:hypothetical protein
MSTVVGIHSWSGLKRSVSWADQFSPVFDDVGELSAERVGRRQGRGAQHVNQVLLFGAQSGPGAEEFAQPAGDLLVARDRGQRLIGEEFGEWFEGGVGVCQPQQHHLLKRHCPMRDAVGCSCQPVRRALFLAVDIRGRKLLYEGQDGLVQFCFAQTAIEPLQRSRHDLGIQTLAVILDQGMAHLID